MSDFLDLYSVGLYLYQKHQETSVAYVLMLLTFDDVIVKLGRLELATAISIIR